jgi:hypothetical protein
VKCHHREVTEMDRRALLPIAAVPFLFAGCGGGASENESAAPAVVEHVKGSNVVRVRLTREAVEHLGVRTAPVTNDGAAAGRLVIPYASVLYDPDGATWTYTNPGPLVFRRQDIRIVRIANGKAVLSVGPHVGTKVVTVGAEEIWGVEYGGIEED